MSYSEDQLRQAVDQVFNNYDKDNSGFLDIVEVTALINDALKHMNAGRQATQDEIKKLLDTIDESKDQKVSKNELLVVFKKVANQK